ncbi:hypothetical protein PMIN03_005091 [Paraphaeosphaeria minitans]
MPTEEENIQYLYLVLTHAGPPTINWATVSTALSLSTGATSKRWSRLRTALESGKPAGKGSYELLWLCVKNSSREKAPNWKAIASACGTTPGAASKRYSRMKAAWDAEDAPAADAAAAAGPATPHKTATAEQHAITPKRKRVPAARPEKAKRNADDGYRIDSADDASPSPKKRIRAPPPTARRIKAKSEPGADVDADTDTDALPMPTSSANQHLVRGQTRNRNLDPQQDSAFRGFPSDRGYSFAPNVESRGFHGYDAGQGEAEEWYESSEYLGGGGGAGLKDRVSGWLDEI